MSNILNDGIFFLLLSLRRTSPSPMLRSSAVIASRRTQRLTEPLMETSSMMDLTTSSGVPMTRRMMVATGSFRWEIMSLELTLSRLWWIQLLKMVCKVEHYVCSLLAINRHTPVFHFDNLSWTCFNPFQACSTAMKFTIFLPKDMLPLQR